MKLFILLSIEIIILMGCGQVNRQNTTEHLPASKISSQSALCVGKPINSDLFDGCNHYTCNEKGEVTYTTLIACQ